MSQVSTVTDAIRFQVKLFSAGEVNAAALVPVFHQWIREDTLGELMIDVADYRHVPGAQAVLLVGHGSDYGLDLDGGRPGLLYHRKRAVEGDAEARLLDALRRTFRAAALLEARDDLRPAWRFRTNEVLVRIADRLRAPNDDAAFTALRPVLDAAFARLYGEGAYTIEREGEPREMFTARVRARTQPSLAEARARLG